MKSMYYAKRKNGRHGFLILVGKDLDQLQECARFRGKEIHFRTGKTLVQSAQVAFGLKLWPKENKPLRLTIENRSRRADFFHLHKIKSGGDGEMEQLWSRLQAIAKDIDALENTTDGLKKNCHTMLFDVLEGAGLEAPWAEYRQHSKAMISDQQNDLSTHPPSSAPQ